MTRRRWIADEVHGDTAILIGEHAAHLGRVLRAQVGQEFDIVTGDMTRIGRITAISEDRVEFVLGDVVTAKSVANLTLALAIFKFDRMEWAIEKCTEIGIARIVPVIARRTDTRLASAAVKRYERWQRIVRQAAEQSRRDGAPEITLPTRLKDLAKASVLASSAAGTTRVVLAETEHKSRLRDVLQSSESAVVLAVGPEGGWTQDELRWFRESGWATASIGETILRAETAAIVAAALAMDALR
jgi:16S rRNA (uracil1498-N3)-methyltransferase